MNASGETQPVQSTRHFHVGENDPDVGTRFEYPKGFLGVAGFDDIETGVGKKERPDEADERFIFDDEDGGG
jgi:hypothetical protein